MAHSGVAVPVSGVNGAARPPGQAPKTKLTPQRLAGENRLHDRILAGLVVVMGFVLASFPINNADFWMQLRTGQLILAGEFRFGEDPYTYTTPADDTAWVHTAWLYDVLLYSAYSVVGPAGLIVLRGLGVALLAWVLLRIRVAGASRAISAASIALALVVLSPRLFMRSELVSLLFLGLTLLILTRPPRSAETPLRAGRLYRLTAMRPWFLLPPLFLLWVNLDYWFFLGPGTVALFLLGDFLQDRLGSVQFRDDALNRNERKVLLLVLAAGLAACLINPYHVRVFQVPGELSSAALSVVKAAQPGARFDLSPFEPAYFSAPRNELYWFRAAGLSLAEWAYYPLALLSGLSFFLNLRGWRWWRFLLWSTFFALTVWQARNAGLFAVIAGPILALNLQDRWLRRHVHGPSVRPAAVALGQLGRIGLLLAILFICILMVAPVAGRSATIGILHPRGSLGWFASEDPSARALVRQLARWLDENRLAGRGLNLSWPDQSAYWAWYAPEHKRQAFLDTRFRLHGDSAAVFFFDVDRRLRETGLPGAENREAHWQKVFRDYDISYLVLSGRDRVVRKDSTGQARELRLIDLLLMDRTRDGRRVWELLDYHDGRNFVLGWTGSPHWQKLQALRFDPDREAYREPAALKALAPVMDSAPGWAALFTTDTQRRPLGCDDSEWLLSLYLGSDENANGEVMPASLSLPVYYPSMVLAGVPIPPLPHIHPLSGATLHLAVRAARRAIAENPQHAESYYQLFMAYRTLSQMERDWTGFANPLRDSQMLAALRQAAILGPEGRLFPFCNLELARRFLEKGYLDLVVEHCQKVAESPELILAQMQRSPGKTREQAISDLRRGLQAELGASLDQMEAALRQRKAAYGAKAIAAVTALDRAQMALQQRLVTIARENLLLALQSPELSAADRMGVLQTLMNLYVELGDLPEALALLNQPDAPQILGSAQYHQLGALAASAYGEYERAAEHRRALDEQLQRAAIDQSVVGLRLMSSGGADAEPPGSFLSGFSALNQGFSAASDHAEQLVMLGLAALEAGQVQAAAEHFRHAIVDVHGTSPYRPLASRYHRFITGKWPENRRD